MNYILTQTWLKLKQNWILVLPVLLEFMVMGMLGVGNSVTLIALFFLHQALTAGWLSQMKIVLLQSERKTTWDDFLEGIARHFWPLLSGSAAYFFIAMVWMALATVLADSLFGQPDAQFLQKLMAQMQANNPENLENFITVNAVPLKQIAQWTQVVLIAGGIGAIFSSVISLWPQYCVFANVSWPKAWKMSKDLTLKHWKPFALLSLIWLLPTCLIVLSVLAPVPVFQVFALMAILLSHTYFTLVFSNFMVLADQEHIHPLTPGNPSGTKAA